MREDGGVGSVEFLEERRAESWDGGASRGWEARRRRWPGGGVPSSLGEKSNAPDGARRNVGSALEGAWVSECPSMFVGGGEGDDQIGGGRGREEGGGGHQVEKGNVWPVRYFCLLDGVSEGANARRYLANGIVG